MPAKLTVDPKMKETFQFLSLSLCPKRGLISKSGVSPSSAQKIPDSYQHFGQKLGPLFGRFLKMRFVYEKNAGIRPKFGLNLSGMRPNFRLNSKKKHTIQESG